MISIEISQCTRSSCQPGNLNRHIRFHFMWKWDCFYVINVSISIAWLNICQPLVMWYLSSGVFCSDHVTRNTLVHICNTLNDTCCIQFRIHSRFHQVYRQLGAGGRLIAVTVNCLSWCAKAIFSWKMPSVPLLDHAYPHNCGLSATRGGRQVAWLHATWGHFLMEHLQMKCAPQVTVLSAIESNVGFCNFLLTCPFWW